MLSICLLYTYEHYLRNINTGGFLHSNHGMILIQDKHLKQKEVGTNHDLLYE